MKKLLALLLLVPAIAFADRSNNPNKLNEVVGSEVHNNVHYPINADTNLSTAEGNVEAHTSFHRFGSNAAVGTTEEDIWETGGVRTWMQTAETLRVKAGGNAADDGVGDGVLTLAANSTDGDTFTIGTKVYTLQDTLTDVDGNIKIGASAAATVTNIVNAIDLGSGTPGVDYATSMTAHPDVDASDGAGDSVDITAPTAGALATTETGAQSSFAAATLVVGAGAQTITVIFLDSSFNEVTETLVTKGASASVATSSTALRLIRAYVSGAGTYGVANTAAIVIENSSSGATQATIPATVGQTQLTHYTIPAGKTGYLTQLNIHVDGTKTATIRMFQRQNADDVTAPYTAKRLVTELSAVQGGQQVDLNSYIVFPAKTDIWFTGFVASTETDVDIDYDLTLVENE